MNVTIKRIGSIKYISHHHECHAIEYVKRLGAVERIRVIPCNPTHPVIMTQVQDDMIRSHNSAIRCSSVLGLL